MVDIGFTFVSRFASNCVLKYLPNGQWLTECGVKPGKKPKYAGKVDVAAPDRVLLHIAAIPEASRAWIGIVWSNALKRKVRVVIVTWDEGNRVVYFSTDTEMDAADIVAIYRCRFQIEFGIRDSRQFTGLHHSQSRSREWLVFAFNISFLHGTCCRPKLTDIFQEIRSDNSKTPSRTRNLRSASLNMPFPTA